MTLQEKININTIELLNSFNKLSQSDIEFKTSENIWSVLEVLEHIFLINKAVLKVIVIPAFLEKTKNTPVELLGEEKINKLLVINRNFKVPAPDFSIPNGRFKNTSDANKNIKSIIDEIIESISTHKIEQETLTIKHPMLGEMTKIDWIHFMISHTNRHIAQIEELKLFAEKI